MGGKKNPVALVCFGKAGVGVCKEAEVTRGPQTNREQCEGMERVNVWMLKLLWRKCSADWNWSAETVQSTQKDKARPDRVLLVFVFCHHFQITSAPTQIQLILNDQDPDGQADSCILTPPEIF